MLSLIFSILIIMSIINLSDQRTMCQDLEDTGNRLKYEKSPYLLQHASNPVDWFPWGEEAFDKAKKEDKPIFLSIGYSTCHWCHVMEEESFADPEIARLMNEAFISIKVDREERPDVDNIYMTVCQAMTGSGGWPLTIIMTPDKKPFFAGTYIPKEAKFGMDGMREFIPKVRNAWKNQRKQLEETASQIIPFLQNVSKQTSWQELSVQTLDMAFNQFSNTFDKEYGGFGHSPKFPTPHNLMFLLRYWKRSGDKDALNMAATTLKKMRMGGIYDHLGFGFHRYSTDSLWLVPHFEKMLYDQALLAMAYAEGYLATGDADFRQTAEEILTYVLRDMISPEGGFYSAEDADSEGEEGKFYLWTSDEIDMVLGTEQGNLFSTVFNVKKSGNFTEQGKENTGGANILHLTKEYKELASQLKIPQQELRSKIESGRQKLFEHREKRIHPYKDDKILTDWNGLMIAALSKAGRAFNRPEYGETAKRAADFVLGTLRKSDGRLLHRFREGEAMITGNLDDYAFMVFGLLELYETTFETKYLQTAIDLNNDMIKHFSDPAGGFFFTADDAEKLLVRPKEYYDGAIPSGNSIAMLNLLRLGRITMDSEFENKAAALARAYSGNISRSPVAYSFLMCALDFALGPSLEIVISGMSKSPDTKEMVAKLYQQFLPNKVVIFRASDEETPAITKISQFTKNQTSIGGKATVYVCRNYACKLPTTEINQMVEMLNEK
jgi:uncharacterized protein YyaL (SSP411 family)